MTIERLLEAGRAFEAGDLERAGEIYRQVAEADPRSSIAVVGLARVALSRGAVDSAIDLARSALAIDPGNAAARRLLEAHRGTDDGAERVATDRVAADTAAATATAGASAPMEGPSPSPPQPSNQDWPWPDLEEQLERYREPGPGRLTRLLRRGRR